MHDVNISSTGAEHRVRESFQRQQVMEFIGAEMTRVESGIAEIELPFRACLSQQHGFFHGGIIGTIADSAAGYAGFSVMPEGASVLTVEYKMNILAPGNGERLRARGEVVKAGRNLVITRADVFVQQGGDEKLCATLLQTLMVNRDRPDLTPG